MLFDEKHITMAVLPFSGGGKLFFGKYVPKREPMPMAIVLGVDPHCFMAGATPTIVPEPDYAGMIRQKPVELVKCETLPLEVPAQAEVIIEGELMPEIDGEVGTGLVEGPFAEYTGFSTGARGPRAMFRAKAITYRNDPVQVLSFFGAGLHDASTLFSLMFSAEMERLLKAQGLPVTGAFMIPQSNHHLLVVGVKTPYPNIATQVANFIFGTPVGIRLYQIVVVPEDVDIYNPAEVFLAFCQRCHPRNGIHIYKDHLGLFALPFLSPEERRTGRGAAVMFDCTFPLEWSVEKGEMPRPVSFNVVYPEAIKQKVLQNWKEMGFRE
jgi:4-hydroxy-3-polyprenylbenzoate decarboxylase